MPANPKILKKNIEHTIFNIAYMIGLYLSSTHIPAASLKFLYARCETF